MLAGASLFFDFDGTLVDLAPTPDGVIVGDDLLRLLDALAKRCPGRVAIVSGRSIEQIDALLGAVTVRIAVAGSHGADLRLPEVPFAPLARPAILDHAIAALDRFAGSRGLLLERKSHGAAIHYRASPGYEAEAVAAAEAIAAEAGLVLQRGKMVVELRAGGDKGRAIATLMERPSMKATRPLFFGDDVTDEDGFAVAAAMGGAGVLIGELRTTAALYRLPDVSALRDWMATTMEGAA
jgi:trehalose 6-phosphate phosphatase